jgi:4-carboxymuconolactone decarboxylase
MQIRREVLGERHVDASVSREDAFTAPFQDFITRTAWGDVWSREGLDRRTRSMITLTALLALGHGAELRLHVRAALTNGVTREEISEVFLHTAIYAGVPAANSAYAAAQEVFASIEEETRADD